MLTKTIILIIYYNYKAIGGARINFALCDDLVISPYFNLGTTLMPRVKNKLQNVKFNLGKKVITEAGIELNYRWSSEIFLTGFVSHTSFGYGKSDWQPLLAGGDTIEPHSTTNELRVGIGMRISFL